MILSTRNSLGFQTSSLQRWLGAAGLIPMLWREELQGLAEHSLELLARATPRLLATSLERDINCNSESERSLPESLCRHREAKQAANAGTARIALT